MKMKNDYIVHDWRTTLSNVSNRANKSSGSSESPLKGTKRSGAKYKSRTWNSKRNAWTYTYDDNKGNALTKHIANGRIRREATSKMNAVGSAVSKTADRALSGVASGISAARRGVTSGVSAAKRAGASIHEAVTGDRARAEAQEYRALAKRHFDMGDKYATSYGNEELAKAREAQKRADSSLISRAKSAVGKASTAIGKFTGSYYDKRAEGIEAARDKSLRGLEASSRGYNDAQRKLEDPKDNRSKADEEALTWWSDQHMRGIEEDGSRAAAQSRMAARERAKAANAPMRRAIKAVKKGITTPIRSVASSKPVKAGRDWLDEVFGKK